MGAEDITREDLLAEVAAFMVQDEFTRPGPDWFTSDELYTRILADYPATEMTKGRMREKLERLCKSGAYEKISNGTNLCYYHKCK